MPNATNFELMLVELPWEKESSSARSRTSTFGMAKITCSPEDLLICDCVVMDGGDVDDGDAAVCDGWLKCSSV